MGWTDELQLRTAAYLVGLKEFAANIGRNVHARLAPDRDMPAADLSGQTCIITGSNAGIGFQLASALSLRGCHIILACRSATKARLAAQVIKEAPSRQGQSDAKVEVAEVSLSSLESVRSFCRDFNAREQPLDILVLNAGIMGSDLTRKVTEDGLEEQFQVNYLSHWLMARELVAEQLERRKAGRKGAAASTRVVFLTSSTHIGAQLDLSDLQLERAAYSGFRGYTQSKLAAILAAKQMQSFLDRSSSSAEDAAVAVHPGMVRTGMADGWLVGSDVFHGFLQPVTSSLLRSLEPAILVPAERAVSTVLYATLAPSFEVKGQYVAYGKVRESSKASQDMALAARLWEASLQLTAAQPNAIEKGA